MKKTISFMLVLAMIATMGIVFPSAFAEETDTGVSYPYTDGICKGIVDRKGTSVVTLNQELDGKKVVKIVPDPVGADAASKSISLDAYELSAKKFDVEKYKYITIEYKYDTDKPTYSGGMQINLLSSKGILKQTVSVSSNEMLETGGWKLATFNIGPVVNDNLGDTTPHYLWQFHFFPFAGTTAKNLTASDVMYIGDITFTSENPNPDKMYKAEFSLTGEGTDSDRPETISRKAGETYTLPECSFEISGATFGGWSPSYDSSKILQPGTTVTMNEANVMYLAKWNIKKVYENTKVLEYPLYCNGIIDSNKFTDITLQFEKNMVIDGLSASMVKPNPKAEKGMFLGFDGWSYSGAGISTEEYKYAAILYKFDTAVEHEGFNAQIRPLTNGGYKKSAFINSEKPLIYGKWDIAFFDLSPLAQSIDTDKPNLGHIHLLPFQEGKQKELDAGDTFYLSKLMFFKEKPEILEAHPSFIKGYENGTFRPNNTMTRAEACTIATRLVTSESTIAGKYESKFTDVAKDSWYYNNIAFLENKGILASYSGAFLPNQAITRAEFVELIYNLGLLSAGDATTKVSFTDVSENHPRYNVITAAATAGLVSGYDDGTFLPDRTITRAQVVKVINNAYGKELYKNKDIAQFDEAPIYSDVAADFWAYVDIMEASIPHGTYEKSEKGEEWFYMSAPDIPVDMEGGSAKLAEIDELANKRKSEILGTATSVNITGKKYYVSSVSGNDTNDGLSEATAWKTIERVSGMAFEKGDGVLFKRGEIFRGNLRTKSFVTYSAYGEGAKPVIAGSPYNGTGAENWTLVDGTTNVWLYINKMVDTGGIVVTDDGGEHLFEKTCAIIDTTDNNYFKTPDRNNPFDFKKDLENHTFFNDQHATSNTTTKEAELYVRCDEGNPGALYRSIEFIDGRTHVIQALSNVTIDNLCVKYGARHGIGAGSVSNLVITNCEIGWIGGGYQNYSGNAGGTFRRGGRYGNGIEVYGGCDNYVIDNCYVYSCFDAGITNQYQKGGTNDIIEKNVTFSNNLIEYCCYNIEYFMGVADVSATRLLQNVVYENNILRNAGYGWGRVNPTNAANIKGWDHYNMADGFVIRNNIFDRSYGDLLHIGFQYSNWIPKFEGNIYVQNKDKLFGHFGQNPTSTFRYDSTAIGVVMSTVGDKTGEVYFLDEIK